MITSYYSYLSMLIGSLDYCLIVICETHTCHVDSLVLVLFLCIKSIIIFIKDIDLAYLGKRVDTSVCTSMCKTLYI